MLCADVSSAHRGLNPLSEPIVIRFGGAKSASAISRHNSTVSRWSRRASCRGGIDEVRSDAPVAFLESLVCIDVRCVCSRNCFRHSFDRVYSILDIDRALGAAPNCWYATDVPRTLIPVSGSLSCSR